MTEQSLPSWHDGSAKKAIVGFVNGVTQAGGPNYVPPPERIATFDNDGTLWCEQPMPVQGFFIADRVKQLAAHDPSLKERQPFKAFIEHDHKTLHDLGKRALQDLFFATHAGVTEEDFEKMASTWFASAKHPKLGRLFTDCAYKPQVELISYLHGNDFKCFIVSGGGVDFIRAFAEHAYGIPREHVIGSSGKLHFEKENGHMVLMKAPELDSFDDREAKPQNIGLHIGRRPILSVGNSDGDLAMLRYTRTGPGARLALLVHHDDAEREFAYDREFKVSPLAEALDRADEYGITLISVKRDWNTVFAQTTH